MFIAKKLPKLYLFFTCTFTEKLPEEERILFQSFSCAKYFWEILSTASINRRSLRKANKMSNSRLQPAIFTKILTEGSLLHRDLWSWWSCRKWRPGHCLFGFQKACISLERTYKYFSCFLFFLIDLYFPSWTSSNKQSNYKSESWGFFGYTWIAFS